MQTIKEQISNKIPYILSHIDRDKYSLTYGCCDRYYWGWKLKDFPDATLQRFAYPLSEYFKQNELLEEKNIEIIISIFKFTKSIMHKDGSLDQAFYNEHSHAATAFVLFDLINSYNNIASNIDDSTKKELILILSRMGNLLVKKDEKHGTISNHILGAGAALIGLYEITLNKNFKTKAKEFIYRIINLQNEEGWYIEYDGCDPGYQTLGIYYISNYYIKTKDVKVFNSIKKAVDFISYFIHPDGTIGGEYGSRNTEIFYPGGFVLMKNDIPICKDILYFMINSIEKGNTINLNSIDQWNLAPLINNYFYIKDFKYNKDYILPWQNNFTKQYKIGGIYINSSEKYYSIFSSTKFIFKVYCKKTNKRIINDTGYIGKYKGKLISTQNTHYQNYNITNNTIIIKRPLFNVKQSKPGIIMFLFLRLYSITFGNFSIFREFTKKLMVKVLISGNKKNKYTITRSINLSNNNTDDSFSDDNLKSVLSNNNAFTTIHMASSKYFNGN